MRSRPSHKNSMLERVGFVLFASVVVSLIWIVQSSASKFAPIAREDSAAKEPRVADKKHKCPNCAPPGDQEIYIPLIDLAESQIRSVTQNANGSWKYTVTKSGSSATVKSHAMNGRGDLTSAVSHRLVYRLSGRP